MESARWLHRRLEAYRLPIALIQSREKEGENRDPLPCMTPVLLVLVVFTAKSAETLDRNGGVAKFSPDGRVLAVGGIVGESGHGAIQLWRTPATREIDRIIATLTAAEPPTP